jgi:2-polyprenyl-3-methyl-5-hydroxy-6-metoxy-1,4-benzoquinol methylase
MFARISDRKPRTLTSIYEAAAGSWQAGLDKLGFTPAYDGLLARACARRPLGQNETVLDAGCGSGAMSAAYLTVAPPPRALVLLDLSDAMLDAARAKLARPVHTVKGAVGDPSLLKDETFDRLFCAHVIEHGDAPSMLNWAFNRLSPGGQIVLSVSKPHWCTMLVQWKWGNKAYRPEEVEALLTRAGFTDIKRHPYAKGPPARISCGYTAIRPAEPRLAPSQRVH